MLAIWKPDIFKYRNILIMYKYNIKSITYLHFILSYILLFILSLYVALIDPSRTLAYFILVTLMGGLILIEIILFRAGFGLILLQIISLIVNYQIDL
jgi:hypothetical protein